MYWLIIIVIWAHKLQLFISYSGIYLLLWKIQSIHLLWTTECIYRKSTAFGFELILSFLVLLTSDNWPLHSLHHSKRKAKQQKEEEEKNGKGGGGGQANT